MQDETGANKPKLIDELRTGLRSKHYSYRTEQSYVYWARRYIRFHNLRHPKALGEPEVKSFCSHLADRDHVSAPTQNQAFNALVFLYRYTRAVYRPIRKMSERHREHIPS